MAITRSSWVDDDGTGTTGTILNNAVKTGLYDQIDALVGAWTTFAFTAGNFLADGAQTWTVASGDVVWNRYRIIDKTLIWQVQLTTTTVAGTPNPSLLMVIPTGTFATVASAMPAALISDNGTVRDGYVAPFDATRLKIALSSGANWAASTNNTAVWFTAICELA